MTRAPEGLPALDAALAEMRAAGVRRLVVEGGDGTVREVMSRAFTLWAGSPPEFAILAAGNSNLIARSAGRIEEADLDRLIAANGARRRALAVLRVARARAPEIRGFVLGAGAYVAATRLAREEIGARHGPQIVLAVLRLLRSKALRAPSSIGFGCDGAPDEPRQRMLVGLTSLPGALIYGLEPFWGGGDGAIRWLDIAADAPRLMLAAPFVAFGAPRRWMRGGYESGRAARATLALDAPFVMDGEEFEAGADGRIEVTAAESATFLSF
ncbi:hypothetical protein G5B40_16565 [Pikeienuella piscinae]|uniref:DAGKc domain-containing protein n=1 Tax=Pikeienuella piscinae TaxID=2748098 RepID=A0A7L5C1A5_9RHOB|nr:diacylglycerol kinase family protein [Pikeienuella piscinae]QIE56908.1 hypothetical protein G5B40_16565 [Pikeienuella piscinae]